MGLGVEGKKLNKRDKGGGNKVDWKKG